MQTIDTQVPAWALDIIKTKDDALLKITTRELKKAEKAVKRAEDERKVLVKKAEDERRELVKKADDERKELVKKAEEAAKRADENHTEALRLLTESTSLTLKEKDNERERLLIELSKFIGVVNMRSIFERGLRAFDPDSPTSDAYEKFAAKHLLTPKGQLTEQAAAWLRELEPSIQTSSVTKELKDLPHELSKELHEVHRIPGETGFHCSGVLPHRAAVALTFLALQQQGFLSGVYSSIKYSDESRILRATLEKGKLIKVAVEEQDQ